MFEIGIVVFIGICCLREFLRPLQQQTQLFWLENNSFWLFLQDAAAKWERNTSGFAIATAKNEILGKVHHEQRYLFLIVWLQLYDTNRTGLDTENSLVCPL